MLENLRTSINGYKVKTTIFTSNNHCLTLYRWNRFFPISYFYWVPNHLMLMFSSLQIVLYTELYVRNSFFLFCVLQNLSSWAKHSATSLFSHYNHLYIRSPFVWSSLIWKVIIWHQYSQAPFSIGMAFMLMGGTSLECYLLLLSCPVYGCVIFEWYLTFQVSLLSCYFIFTHFIINSIKIAYWLEYTNCLSSGWCLCNSCSFPICRFCRCYWKCRIPYDRESSEVGWYTLCYWDLWLLLCWALCISEYIPINVWSHKVQQGTVHMVGIFVSSMKLILIWWLYLIFD